MPSILRARSRAEKRGLFAALAAAISLVLTVSLLPAGAALAEDDDPPALLGISKIVDPSTANPLTPGDVVSYTVTLSCSNVNDATGCQSAALTDPVPAPLVLVASSVTVVGSPFTNATADNTVNVTFTQPIDGGGTGINDGRSVIVTYSATLPVDVSGDADGIPIVNTATFTATNSYNSPATSSATVTPDVALTLGSSVTKTVDPVTAPSVPGTPVTVSLTAANTSNQSVDTLTVQDPAEGSSSPFNYLAVTGIADLVPPAGANRVQLQWLNTTTNTWSTAGAAVEFPADPSTLLPSPIPANLGGVRLTFSKFGGQLPSTVSGQEARIVLATAMRSAVDSITVATAVDNTASSLVTKGVETTSPVRDTKTLTITKANLGPFLTKVFDDTSLVPGEQTVATLESKNGDFGIVSMVVSEPRVGEKNLAEQGLGFDGFVSGDIEWPGGATGASVLYIYDDALPAEAAKTTSDLDTLPGPDPDRPVSGFTVTFTGAIAAHAYATLPFTVTALPLGGTEDTTETNIAHTSVETADHRTGEASAQATLTRTPARVYTTTNKQILPGEAFSVAGSVATIRLPSRVNARTDIPASTIGAQQFSVTDPAVPSATVDTFWDYYNLISIPKSAVPANALLTVSYWDGSAWTDLVTDVAGPTMWGTAIPSNLRNTIQGIRFEYTPKVDGQVLQPNFEVVPYLQMSLRSTLRSDSSQSAADPDALENLALTNTSRSEATNSNADPSIATDDGEAGITLKPINGDGSGVTLVDKDWISPSDKKVFARTGDQATARIGWRTDGVPLDEVRITDPAPVSSTATTLPAVEETVYEAFDLVSISPITTATDPLITFDRVTGVYLYNGVLGYWQDVTSMVCAEAADCDGAFPGYVLTDVQRESATGVRLVFDESPTRDDRIDSPTDPAVGTGVAASTSNRPLDFVFAVRDTKRSDGSAVVGRDVYNVITDPASTGVVNNTVRADGIVGGSADFTTVDDDNIQIDDIPLNVSAAKTWQYGPLGVPPLGTDHDLYPIAVATVTAKNETTARVNELRLQDPNPEIPVTEDDPSPFDFVNLQQILSVTVPDGANPALSRVVLSYSDWSPASFTLDEALALSSTDLADVVGLEVIHQGRIESGQSTVAELAFQLREYNRSLPTQPVSAEDVAVNTVLATVVDPGGINATGFKTDQKDASLAIDEPNYSAISTKDVSPATRFEDDTDRSETVTLSGTTSGSVRTTSITYTDAAPTFFNAYQFTGFLPVVLVAPIDTITVEALVGVDYTVTGNTIAVTCDGETDLSECWRPVQTVTGTPGSSVSISLPLGIHPADVRGIRYTLSRADGANWERPYNPTQQVSFTADRRVNLVTGGAVPSTRPTIPATPPAPGETVLGTTTNTFDVLATGSWGTPANAAVLWTAESSSTDTVRLMHRTNSVQIVKTPTNVVAPGTRIPFTISTTNTGSWPMAELEIVDTIESDGNGALLVLPELFPGDDPLYSVTLTGAGNTTLAPPVVTPNLVDDTITFGLPSNFVLEPGQTLALTVNLILRPDLGARRDVMNSAVVTADRIFDTCVGAVNTVLQPVVIDTATCETSTVVVARPAAPVQVLKGVKGVGAGLPGVASDAANYNDLGVLAYSGAPSTAYCNNPNASLSEGYYRTPCVPITRPGGVENWKNFVSNPGNIPSEVISLIDILPASNDRGVIINQARSSRWTPVFTGGIAFDFYDNTYTPAVENQQTWYLTTVPSTVCNRLDILKGAQGSISASDVDGTSYPGETTACLADVAARNWQPYSASMTPTQLASIKALKVVVTYAPGEGLMPQETFGLSYNSTTAAFPDRAETSDRDSIAWNSVAAAAVGVDPMDATPAGRVVSQVREARKAGIAMAVGKLDLSKLVVKPTLFPTTPATYGFSVQCTSLGQSVPLRGVSSNDLSHITLKADGTVLHYNDGLSSTYSNVNLPLFADCTLVEDAAQGVDVTYSPATSVKALRNFSTRTDVSNPASSASLTPTGINAIQATNTYEFAGFTISKAVTTGGAVDEDGESVTRPGPFAFDVKCTFLGTTVLDKTISIGVGSAASHSETGLPGGASCTVTEGSAGGSSNASTSMVVTTSAGSTTASGKTATFVLSRNSEANDITNTIAVTNAFTVGAVRLTKVVSGTGSTDWGNEDFSVRLRCTLSTASPTTVYDKTFTLSKATASALITNLATGASCTVSETAKGGANGTPAISPSTFTVGTQSSTSPRAVSITNTFTVGSVRVSKALSGEPAASMAGATGFKYEMTLECTRDVDGVAKDIAIPGGSTRTITGAGTATFTGLPTGASCTVSETNKGHATSSALTPVDGKVTVGNGTTVDVTATNTFANGSLPVRKTVDGASKEGAPSSFAATVTCLWQGVAVALANDGEITLVDGETTTVTNVPVGSVCSVTEEDAGQKLPNPSTPSSVIVGAGSTLTLDVTNTYETASLRVSKTVSSKAAVVPTNFEFSVVCTFLGDEVLDTTFTLSAGESRDFDDLPARSSCEVVETNARGADGTVSGGTSASGTVVLDQATRTVTIDELSSNDLDEPGTPRNEATFLNLFNAAAFTVTKVLSGAGSTQFGDSQTFNAHVICTFVGDVLFDDTLPLNKGNGFTTTILDLVEGSTCLVTETALNGADAVVATPNDGDDTTTGVQTIPAEGVVGVELTNWYLTGSLVVTKTFAGDGADKFGTRDYTVQLVCTRDGLTVTIPEGGTRVLSATAPATTFAVLPTGSSCTLTETVTGGANSTRIVGADDTTLATDATAGYTFVVATSATDLSVTDQPQPALAVENTFNFATVSVTKAVDSDAVDVDGLPLSYGPFEVSLECTFAGVAVTAAEASTRSIAAGETISWTQLPQSAACVVSETDDADASATSITVTQGSTPDPVVLGSQTPLAPLLAVEAGANTAVITNLFEVGSVLVSKVIAGTAPEKAVEAFPVTLVCTLVDASYPEPGLIVRDVEGEIGGPEALELFEENIPSGADCVVTETDAKGADRTQIVVDDGDPVFAKTVTFTLEAGAVPAATVVVTNTFDAPLANTGLTGLWFVWVGLAAAGLGGALVLVTRRRRPVRRH